MKDKIAKLLAKAEGTDNEHEAEAFMAKVHQLLAEHNIAMAELKTPESNSPVGEITFEYRGHNQPWLRTLWGQTARLYFCDMFYTANGKHVVFHLIGTEDNVTTALGMARYFTDSVFKQAKKYRSENPGVTGKEIDSFKRGCAFRLTHRIHQKREEEDVDPTAPPEEYNPSNLPAIYDQTSKEVEAYIQENHPNLVTRSAKVTIGDPDAYSRGREAGNRIGLDKQVSSDTHRRLH